MGESPGAIPGPVHLLRHNEIDSFVNHGYWSAESNVDALILSRLHPIHGKACIITVEANEGLIAVTVCESQSLHHVLERILVIAHSEDNNSLVYIQISTNGAMNRQDSNLHIS
ncbi:hypothetical protein FVEN_g10741 [Fusarium venenatum]|nr:hypothetical protein FVEN_g10741 [Fusarium venenatum]